MKIITNQEKLMMFLIAIILNMKVKKIRKKLCKLKNILI